MDFQDEKIQKLLSGSKYSKVKSVNTNISSMHGYCNFIIVFVLPGHEDLRSFSSNPILGQETVFYIP